jgi:adenine-specific DNA-methyltransferase
VDASLLDFVEGARRAVAACDKRERAVLGQFMTPATLATFMVNAFGPWPEHVRLLDAGAGVGSLTAAVVAQICAQTRARSVAVDLYELDPGLVPELARTVQRCRALCAQRGITFRASIKNEDFVRAMLAGPRTPLYDRVIVNPPYRKIDGSSAIAGKLRRAGLPANNLYATFLALCVERLADGGELVAITPRSFCNGPYFRGFRRILLGQTALCRLHVFDSRRRAFEDDRVLQENLVFCAAKRAANSEILVSSSAGPDAPVQEHHVARDRVVWPGDRDLVIHLALSPADAAVAETIRALPCALADLGLSVSTGRVVDFRVERHLRHRPAKNTVPLIYPLHFDRGAVRWPAQNARKPNALVANGSTQGALVPRGYYALTKRLSSKEEPRRIVAAVFDPELVVSPRVGFENHVNFFHREGAGLARELARGLACFLNSSLVDRYFRQYSGHTQVNAADLRRLRYPSAKQLAALARRVGERVAEEAEVDAALGDLVTSELS